jgi:hypothetical protein
MLLRLSVLLNACLAALLVSPQSVAVTVEHACPGPSIEADSAFREHYPELLERLRTDLPARAHVDACAVVELRLEAPVIVVAVSLPDGRATARDVARHEDILPTLQALLLVPEATAAATPGAPAPAPTPTTAKATPEAAPTRALVPLRAAAQKASLRRAQPEAAQSDSPQEEAAGPRPFGFELSLVGGTRAGDGQYGYGFGVLSFMQIKGWLVGFQGRADGYRAMQGSDPETALALGLLTGRRFDFGSLALDLTAGPAVVMRGASFSASESVSVPAGSSASSAPMQPPPESDVGPLPRLLLGARLGFTPHSLFRTFVGIDGELGPTHDSDVEQGMVASGRMPLYTVGLSLGATLGTR